MKKMMTVACIVAAAFDYLKAHKGIAFLSEHYDIEHTYSIDEAPT